MSDLGYGIMPRKRRKKRGEKEKKLLLNIKKCLLKSIIKKYKNIK